MPAGTSAPWNTSCVLMTRSERPVVVTAIVCADSMASPSRMRTSEGGNHDAERARHRDRGGAGCRGHAVCGKARCDDAREREHARADRTVHRPEQRAEAHPRYERRRRPARQHGEACAIERVGDRKPVEQQAHGHVERQRLQQVGLEQVDQPAGQRGEQYRGDRTAEDRNKRAYAGGPDQDERGGKPRQHDPGGD